MKWNHVSAGLTQAAQSRFFTGLGDSASSVIEKMVNDPPFLEALVRFAKVGSRETSVSQRRAREIMGENMLGIDEAAASFGLEPSMESLVALYTVPFSDWTLRWVRRTHMLVAVLPISITEMEKTAKLGNKKLFHHSLDADNPFIVSTGKANWCLIRRNLIKGSSGKGWQPNLLPWGEEPPPARVVVYATLLAFMAKQMPLYNGTVWCPEKDGDGGGAPARLFVSVQRGEVSAGATVRDYGGRSCDVGMLGSKSA